MAILCYVTGADKPQKSRKCPIYTTSAIKGEGISAIVCKGGHTE